MTGSLMPVRPRRSRSVHDFLFFVIFGRRRHAVGGLAVQAFIPDLLNGAADGSENPAGLAP